jgi:hypothetical protein
MGTLAGEPRVAGATEAVVNAADQEDEQKASAASIIG